MQNLLRDDIFSHFSGPYSELYACWWCCSGNCSRVHANALRLSDRGILLWYYLNTGLYLPHGTASLYFNALYLLWDNCWTCSYEICTDVILNLPLFYHLYCSLGIFSILNSHHIDYDTIRITYLLTSFSLSWRST